MGLSCNLTTFPVPGLGATPGLGMNPFVCTAARVAWSERKRLEEEPVLSRALGGSMPDAGQPLALQPAARGAHAAPLCVNLG